MKAKFVGNSYTFHDIMNNQDLEMVNGNVYDIEVASEAPQVVVNGVPQLPQDNDGVWVRIGSFMIPYMYSLFKKAWDLDV